MPLKGVVSSVTKRWSRPSLEWKQPKKCGTSVQRAAGRHKAQIRLGGILNESVLSTGAAAVFLALACALDLNWLVRFRFGYVTEWDESGYLSLALNDTTGLLTGGLHGLAHYAAGGPEAPLVPLASVPVLLLLGRGIDQALLVPVIFFGVLVVSSYALALRLTRPAWAAVAAATVASIPGVTDYSRLYHFAVPAAAFFTLTLYALVRSSALQDRLWVVLGGALLGLTLLSRTMTLAFAPGIALAALSRLMIPGTQHKRQILNLALGLVAAGIVAGPWYLWNAQGVLHYLVGSGYGASSGAYGPARSVWSLQYWTKDLGLMLQHLYLPLCALLAIGLVVGVASSLPGALRLGIPGSLRAGLSSDWTVLALALGGGYLALTSSRNAGTAFSLPLLPILVVLSVAALGNTPARHVRRTLGFALVALALFNLVMKSGYSPALAQYRSVDLPMLGAGPVSDGRGLIQLEVAAAGYSIGSPTTPFPPLERRWLPLAVSVAREVVDLAKIHGERPAVMLGGDDLIFSDTRLDLASAAWLHTYLDGSFLKPFPNGDTVASYRSQMQQIGAAFLITLQPNRSGGVTITRSKVESAARSLGFVVVHRFRLPDGRLAWLWRRVTAAGQVHPVR